MIDQVKAYIAEKYVDWKTNRIIRDLEEISIDLPSRADKVTNVLIILPKQTEFVDAAVTLKRRLSRHFKHWQFMMLDIDKVLHHKLNKLDLPNPVFLQELREHQFDMAIDLNMDFDLRIGFMVTMLKIPYRVRIQKQAGEFYNIVVQTRQKVVQNFDFVFENLKTIFAV